MTLIEPIADSAHVLSVIDNAFDKMEMFFDDHLLDAKGEDIKPQNYDIAFRNVEFSYSDANTMENRKVLKDVVLTFRKARPPDRRSFRKREDNDLQPDRQIL